MVAENKSDWSQLPEELLHIISNNLEDHCFDVIHARSVCSHWRSSFPFPSCLLRKTYSLPSLPFQEEDVDFCKLEKFTMFLFRVHTLPIAALSPSEFFLGGIGQYKAEDDMDIPSRPLQCSVKVKIPGSEPALMNILNCQILPLGDHYRITAPGPYHPDNILVAFLPKGGGEFVLLVNYSDGFFMLTSAEMRWNRIEDAPHCACTNLVAFKDRFYATYLNDRVIIINPYSLVITHLIASFSSTTYLVPSGNHELFLVKKVAPLTCRVSRLDEEADQILEVNGLGDRVLFINKRFGNVSCSAKELPRGCGLSGNSILLIDEHNVTHLYKYKINGGGADEELYSFGEISQENRVMILSSLYSFSVLAFQVVC